MRNLRFFYFCKSYAVQAFSIMLTAFANGFGGYSNIITSGKTEKYCRNITRTIKNVDITKK